MTESTQSDKLRKLVADEIAKLKAQGKRDLSAPLERLDKTIIDIETQMKGLNPKTEVGKEKPSSLEKALKEVETKLEAEFKELSGSFFADDELTKILDKMKQEKKKLSNDGAELEAFKKKMEEEMKKAMGSSYYAVEIDDLFTKKKELK